MPNVVRTAVTIRATYGVSMDAPGNLAIRLTVTLTASQGLAGPWFFRTAMRDLDLAVAVLAIHVFMCAGRRRRNFMTLCTVELSAIDHAGKNVQHKKDEQPQGPGHLNLVYVHDRASVEGLMQSKYVLVGRNSIGVFRNGRCSITGIKNVDLDIWGGRLRGEHRPGLRRQVGSCDDSVAVACYSARASLIGRPVERGSL